MIKTSTVSLERFKNAVGFTATYSCKWGNTRKAAIEKIALTKGTQDAEQKQEEAKAKTRMQLKKQLIVSPEYDEIKSFMAEIRSWTYRQTVPSFFKEGFQLCGLPAIDVIETRMRKAVRDELPNLVQKFIDAYPAQIAEARTVLEPVGQFNALEYPAPEEMRSQFDISWNWITFTVPDQLPEALRKEEQDKLERQFADASQEITLALRVAFQKLIAHAADKLKVEPGDKPKKIFDSMIGNVQEFIDTFANRNIMNDTELAVLISKAKEMLIGITPQKIRDLPIVRDETAKKFDAIKTTLDGMITTTKGRKFNVDADDEPSQEPAQTSAEAPAQGELAAA